MIGHMNILKNISGVFAAAVMLLAVSCQKGEHAYPEMYTEKGVYELPKDGGSVVVKLMSTRDWVASLSPATSQDDIEGVVIDTESGKASAEFVEICVTAPKNEEYPRSIVVSFVSEDVSVAVTVNQAGYLQREIEKLTVEDFLAKSVDNGIWYELTGTITNLANTVYGNFTLVDDTGSVYVYGLTKEKVSGSNDQSFSSIGLKEGDIVTLKGTRGEYNGSPQVSGPAYYVSHVPGVVDPSLPLKVSVEEFLAAEEGSTVYELTGKITKITTAYSEQYGNISFDLADATGEVNVFRMKCDDIEAPSSIAVGDVVTVQGKRASYKGSAQVGEGSVCVSYRGSTVVTIADFLTKEKSKDVWYKLTGTIKEIVNEEYGSLYLEEDSGSYVYVYGITKAPVSSNDKSFASLGLAEGDKITIVGTRDRYDKAGEEDQKDQVGGPAYFVEKHETATLE